MDLYNLVVSAKLTKGGGGGDIDVDALNVTENGTYSASSGHAFDPVIVSVPQSGITPTGTKDITSNGIYDVESFKSASVNVPQPSGTSVITANGLYNVTDFSQASVSVPTGITPSGTSSITANGIYDITNFASVDVNVSGGGGGDHDAEDGIIQRTLNGVYENSRVTKIGINAFYSCYRLKTASFPNVTDIGSSAFQYCGALTTAIFPNVISIGTAAFRSCSSLMTAVFLASSVAILGGSNAFASTPMSASTYTGSWGSIYVPASLVDSYKSAYAWSVYADRITSYVE